MCQSLVAVRKKLKRTLYFVAVSVYLSVYSRSVYGSFLYWRPSVQCSLLPHSLRKEFWKSKWNGISSISNIEDQLVFRWNYFQQKMQIMTCHGHLHFNLNNFFHKMGCLAGDRGEAPAAYHSLGDSVNKTRFHPLSKFWRGWSWSWKCICCCKVGWGFRFITIFPGGRGMGNYKTTQIWLRVLMINQIISKSFYCEIHQLWLFYLVQNYSKVMETTTFGLGHTVVA